MPISDGISSLFDNYGRQARLFPGLLVIFPPLLTILAWFPWLIVSNAGGTLLTLGTSCGLLYALASYARTKGKRVEPRLLAKWGAWPSTILLRHSGGLDQYTLQRYHQFLASSVPNLSFPSSEDEKNDPAAADAVYTSAVNWLKERTRGKHFSMILRENAQYGFRRNLRGLKRVGIASCAFSFLVSFISIYLFKIDIFLLVIDRQIEGAIVVFREIGAPLVAALAVDILAILGWLFVVTDQWVWEAGMQYAKALLASCDKIPIADASD